VRSLAKLYNEDRLSLRVSWDVIQEAEERPLLEDVTKDSSKDRDWEH
jgi:hypothetical protein